VMLSTEQKSALLMPFVGVIKDNRLKRGISQARLALAADLSSKYVTLLESAKRVPSIECVIALAAKAGVPRTTIENLLEEVLDHFEWEG